MNDIQQRVARGAAVLDHFCPDWEFRVAPERITSIYEPYQCVLCATHGDYKKGVIDLFGSFMGGYVCGFAVLRKDDAVLTAAWQTLIAERRKAMALVEVAS